MDDRRSSAAVDRRLHRWLREEVQVPAPDRLIEDVFARTTEMSQVHGGWSLLPWRRRSPRARRPGWSFAFGALALVAIAVGAASVGGSIGRISEPTTPSAPDLTPTAPPSASVPTVADGSLPRLIIERTHQTCSRRGTLTILPGAGATPASAWVTCGADSQEIVLGTDAIVDRPGLGTIAADAGREWALRGDSVVRLNPDRSIAGTVRIGSPGALAVSGATVWVLDIRTGTISSVGTLKVGATVRPAPAGRPIALAIAGGRLWVLDQAGARLLRLDLQDGHLLSSIPVQSGATQLVQAAGAFYVTSLLARSIVRVDPATATATTLLLDLGPDGNLDALGGSRDGLILGSHTTVHRLDPLTGALKPGAMGSAYISAVSLLGTTALILTDDGVLTEAALP